MADPKKLIDIDWESAMAENKDVDINLLELLEEVVAELNGVKGAAKAREELKKFLAKENMAREKQELREQLEDLERQTAEVRARLGLPKDAGLVCGVCGKQVASARGMDVHRARVHGIPGDRNKGRTTRKISDRPLAQCDVCGGKYKNLGSHVNMAHNGGVARTKSTPAKGRGLSVTPNDLKKGA